MKKEIVFLVLVLVVAAVSINVSANLLTPGDAQAFKDALKIVAGQTDSQTQQAASSPALQVSPVPSETTKENLAVLSLTVKNGTAGYSVKEAYIVALDSCPATQNYTKDALGKVDTRQKLELVVAGTSSLQNYSETFNVEAAAYKTFLAANSSKKFCAVVVAERNAEAPA